MDSVRSFSIGGEPDTLEEGAGAKIPECSHKNVAKRCPFVVLSGVRMRDIDFQTTSSTCQASQTLPLLHPIHDRSGEHKKSSVIDFTGHSREHLVLRERFSGSFKGF